MGVPYVRGSDTSKEAATKLIPGLSRLEGKVFALFVQADRCGLTDDEVEVASNLRHQTASARRRGLVQKGMLRDSGQRRQTRSKRNAVVWVTTGTLCPEQKTVKISKETIKEAVREIRSRYTLTPQYALIPLSVQALLQWLDPNGDVE